MTDRPDLPPPTDSSDPREPDFPPSSAQPARPRRKRRWLRRVLWTLAVLLVLLVLLVALAPTLISTGPGTRLAASITSGQINGHVDLDGLTVGWTNGIKLDRAVVTRGDTLIAELANFSSELSLIDAIRQNFDLGRTQGRLNLPVVLVYDDGTTNLHEVFPQLQPNEDQPADDAPTEIPDFRVDGKFDVLANVQYLGSRDSDQDDTPAVDVEIDAATFKRMPGQPLEHDVPVAMRIGGQNAGQIRAVGTIDPDSFGTDQLQVEEEVTLSEVQLAAVNTLAAAFGADGYEAQGVLNGTAQANAAQNELGAQLVITDLKLAQRAGESVAAEPLNDQSDQSQGYETDRLEVTLNGSYRAEALPADQQVRTADGKVLTTRQLVAIEQFRIATAEDETLTAGAVVDLLVLQTDPAANWPMLARNVTLNLQTPYATAQGQGETLGTFTLTASADLGSVRQRFGDLAPALVETDPQGRLELSLQTAQAMVPEIGPAVVVSYDLAVRDLVLQPPEEEPAQVASLQPTPPEAPQEPMRLGAFQLAGRATLARPAENARMGIARLDAEINAADAQGEPVLTGTLSAADIDGGTGSIGSAAVQKLVVPSYGRLRQSLGSWAALPAEEQPLEPISVSVVATRDGTNNSVRLTEPLRVLLGSEELVNVSARAHQPGETTWQIDELQANANMPAVSRLSAALGSPISAEEPAQGRVSLLVSSDAPLRFEASDPLATLAGRVTVDMKKATAKGMSLTGQIPVVAEAGHIMVPADAPPLAANGGQIALAGTVMERQGENWVLQPPAEAEIVQNVSLNPVLMDAAGKRLNPVFAQPESAAGFLDVKLTGGRGINLADPFGPDSSIAITFSVRELAVDNDVIAGFADATLGEILAAVRQQASAIPGLDAGIRQKLAGFDLSEEVKQEIRSIRGSIADAQVELRNGVAQTRITINLGDPRQGADQGARYPLSFAGGVNVNTLATQGLGVTIPRQLIEKWAGENPGDLVAVVGERPFQKLLPNGLTVGVGGSTVSPRPDVSAFVNDQLPQILRTAARDAAENAIRRGLGDRLGDLLPKR